MMGAVAVMKATMLVLGGLLLLASATSDRPVAGPIVRAAAGPGHAIHPTLEHVELLHQAPLALQESL